jgi:hypothetical protein
LEDLEEGAFIRVHDAYVESLEVERANDLLPIIDVNTALFTDDVRAWQFYWTMAFAVERQAADVAVSVVGFDFLARLSCICLCTWYFLLSLDRSTLCLRI